MADVLLDSISELRATLSAGGAASQPVWLSSLPTYEPNTKTALSPIAVICDLFGKV